MPRYDVSMYYHTYGGIIVRISTSNWFTNLTFFVIGLNAIWLGIDADHNTEET